MSEQVQVTLHEAKSQLFHLARVHGRAAGW